MADLASFSLSDRRAAPHSRAHQYRLTAVSAVIQSSARLERGRTLNNVRGREGGREGRGGEGRGVVTTITFGFAILKGLLIFRPICLLSSDILVLVSCDVPAHKKMSSKLLCTSCLVFFRSFNVLLSLFQC